jgi:hypothetical protein
MIGRTVENKDVFVGASMDGFTAILEIIPDN